MLKIAHRGASAHGPENTLTAFRKALAMGADAIELDVHRCKSGELVVIHDDTVERTTDGKGDVARLTLDQLRQFHIKGGEHIPTLEEALDGLGRDVTYFLECKHAYAIAQVAELIDRRVAQGWRADKLWLITFEHAPLGETLGRHPKVYGGASYERLKDESAGKAKALGARAILPHYTELTRTHVEQAHARGLKVFVWTVNEPSNIYRMRNIGVDGIMSDFPDRL